ncbi:MAG TPA: IS4 family transposase [Verrucomicrobiae bacterium]|nr:IS4 family transposase [Verrucomicrobiae bacterium]
MSEALSSPEKWAQAEFGVAPLGDARRTRRLVQIAEQLAANPGGTLPQAFSTWAELKAAYRLFDQPQVGFQQVITSHLERARAACARPGEYLLIEDTTLLDYSGHPQTEGLGVIGDGRGRGFELHTTLAVRVEQWTPEQRPQGTLVGLFDQQCLRPQPAPKGESRGQRLARPRKSQRWAAGLKAMPAAPPAARWIFVADCEADFYEPMQVCQRQGIDFIIRSFQDRRLADGQTHLRDALNGAEVTGQSTVEVSARPGQPARSARLEVRAVVVDLDGPWRPGGWQAPLRQVTAIELRETDPPQGVEEPLRWVLLTSLACASWEQIQRVVGRYTARWWIEEYHKALKSGTRVEASQLESAGRLEPLIAILALVAARLLTAKLLARGEPAGRASVESFGPEIVALLEKKFGVPKAGWTNQNLLTAIARLGGFPARKSDGLPGWQTIWRGWHRLLWMAQALDLTANR